MRGRKGRKEKRGKNGTSLVGFVSKAGRDEASSNTI
jgi:hypothetical protein